MRHRDYLKKNAVQTTSKQHHGAHKKQRNKLIKKTKAEYLKNQLNSSEKILKKCGKQ